MLFSSSRLQGFYVGQIVFSQCGCKRGTVTEVCPRLGVVVQWESHAAPYGCIPEAVSRVAPIA